MVLFKILNLSLSISLGSKWYRWIWINRFVISELILKELVPFRPSCGHAFATQPFLSFFFFAAAH